MGRKRKVNREYMLLPRTCDNPHPPPSQAPLAQETLLLSKAANRFLSA